MFFLEKRRHARTELDAGHVAIRMAAIDHAGQIEESARRGQSLRVQQVAVARIDVQASAHDAFRLFGKRTKRSCAAV